MAIIDFGGVKEEVVTRKEFPLAKARKVLKGETIAIIGYGVQGPAQALNLKDNGFKVIIGQAPEFKRDWDRAVADGWVPGKTLFDIETAVKKGTVIQMLVSDAAQRTIWPVVKKNLKKGDALYFSHGFSITYKDKSGVVPPKWVDVIMVAPKGSGTSVRRNFLCRRGHQFQLRDRPGRDRPRERALHGARHRDRLGLPVPDDLPARDEQRSDRRARRVDGLSRGRHGSAVRDASQARAQPERGVQRNGGRADPEPDPAGRRERHGLDVLELLGDGPARRAGLDAEIQEGRPARV